MPVTTPIAKLIKNSFPKNLVARRYLSLLVRYQAVCKPATRKPDPIVIGTNIKWYTVVMANCHLAKSSAFIGTLLSLVSDFPLCVLQNSNSFDVQFRTERCFERKDIGFIEFFEC